MLSYFDFLYLSYSGRIGRTAYWLGFIGLNILQFVALWGLFQLSHETFEQLAAYGAMPKPRTLPRELINDLLMHVLLPVGIVSVLFLYPAYAITTKRWHDRGKSGWWSLIAFVPIIGALWMFIELGFLGGQSGTNEYGYREGA